MAYTTINKGTDYFNTLLWTGNSGNQSITGNNFTADLTWSKTRSNAESHVLMDTVRDAGTTLNQSISSNTTNAEGTLNNSSTLTVNSTGFDLAGTSGGTLNYTGYTYATWLWKAGGHTGSSNTDGSITSTVSANTTSGFSIIKYTGSGSASTVGHGLGAAPDVTIRKKLNTSDDWYVHTTLIDGSFDFLRLNTTAAKSDSSLTGFTSTTVGVAASSYEEIIYAFKSIKGFSKIGTYVGNGNADGPFVYTGFKPAFLLFKGNNTSDWQLFDNKRDPENPVERALHPDINNTASTDQELDFTSNGFKIRDTGAHFNGSGVSFFYIAFAESPLIGTNNVPVTAR